uniref:hypothetical protein n=1 Tax=Cephaleuros parasiticus TaxID=173370 RepID=UPI001EDF11BD|nr:hypothetical protein MFQ79_pgp107 [Cephaleuros parasiticus]UIB38955.1 hypothetical protein [Cephaleuros parasiticus]
MDPPSLIMGIPLYFLSPPPSVGSILFLFFKQAARANVFPSEVFSFGQNKGLRLVYKYITASSRANFPMFFLRRFFWLLFLLLFFSHPSPFFVFPPISMGYSERMIFKL